MPDDDRLFDIEPEPEPEKQPGDLYKPPHRHNPLHSVAENKRVRELHRVYLTAQAMLATGEGTPSAKALGKARGVLAEDMVALGVREGVRYYHARVPPKHAKGTKAAVDNLRTHLRRFWMGVDDEDWFVVLVETVICDSRGLARPGGWYNLQRQLPGA